ncbi:MAG: HAD family hydrolase [Candidatus Saccharimonadales bacterium]
MKQYQYILFDWDGTLVRTLDIWLESLRAASEEHGHYFSDKDIGANFELFRQRFEAQGYSGANTVIERASVLATRDVPRVMLYPCAREALSHLQDTGKQTALVTTSTHEYVDPLLKRHTLNTLFDAVVCGGDTERVKPDAQPVIEAMRSLKADPTSTLLIGDSENDILAARNAGIDSMLFYPESHYKFYDIKDLRSLKPTYVINNLSDILNLF